MKRAWILKRNLQFKTTTTLKCGECEQIFTNRKSLYNHFEINPHKFTFLPCDKCHEFKTKDILKLKSHGLLEHFNCQECDLQCKSLSTAKTHYYEKHTMDENEKKFECEFCPYKTHIKRYLAEHFTRRHKKKIFQSTKPPPPGVESNCRSL